MFLRILLPEKIAELFFLLMFDEEESDDEGHRPLFFLFSRCCQPQPGELDQPGKM